MADMKRYAIAGGTFACILAIGFFMQNGAKTPPADGTPAMSGMTVQPGAPVEEPGQLSEIALTASDEDKPAETHVPMQELTPPAPETMAEAEIALPDEATPVSAPSDFAPIPVPEADEAPVEVSLLVEPEPANAPVAASREDPQEDPQCDITMTAKPIAAALVELDLAAPCLPNERMTMHHSGMMFTDTTDAEGNFQMAVPALSQTAVFIASFANGDGAVASASVPELADFDRAVVQSEFESSAGLHALEFGADYEGAGHVRADAAGQIADAAIGKGGFMVTLGNPAVSDAIAAQVYTFPTGFAERGGEIALSVEIEVTAANCGKRVEAQSLQTVPGAAPKVQSLELTMPDCDAVGDFLVLKKLVNDLTVASATN